MKAINRIPEIAIKIVILIAAVTSSSSISAQIASDYNKHVDESKAKTTIRVAENANPHASALPIRNDVNSPYDDIKPRLTPDGSRLYFSRNFHPANVDGLNDAEDIWYSEFNSQNNTWTEPIHMKGVLNNAGPNYVNNVSATGDTIILGNEYMKKGKMRAGLSYSVNINGMWSIPTPINIVNGYNMSASENSFVSLKNGIIIQSVERVESVGGRDLFVSFWNGEKATEPVNMGAIINTQFEESSPYLAADNKTLYFASKGHSGFGGYDIYVTRRLDDTWTNWSTPENLGPAVNGENDEEFFSVTQCGQFAVFSKQVSIHNNDLFRISMNELFGTQAPAKSAPVNTPHNSSIWFASL